MNNIILLITLFLTPFSCYRIPYESIYFTKPDTYYNSSRICGISPYFNMTQVTTLLSTNKNYYFNTSTISFKLNITKCSTIFIDVKFTTNIKISYSEIPKINDTIYTVYRGGLLHYTMLGELYVTLYDNVNDDINLIIYDLGIDGGTDNMITILPYNSYNLSSSVTNNILSYYIEPVTLGCSFDSKLYINTGNLSLFYDDLPYFVYPYKSNFSYTLTIISTSLQNCIYNIYTPLGNSFFSNNYASRYLFYNRSQINSYYILLGDTYSFNNSNITIYGYQSTLPNTISVPPLDLNQSLTLYYKLVNLIKSTYTVDVNQDIEELVSFINLPPINYSLTNLSLINSLINSKIRYFDNLISLVPGSYYWILDTYSWDLNGFLINSPNILSINVDNISNPTHLLITGYSSSDYIIISYPIGMSVTVPLPYILDLYSYSYTGFNFNITDIPPGSYTFINSNLSVYGIYNSYNLTLILDTSLLTLSSNSIFTLQSLTLKGNSSIIFSQHSKLTVISCVNLSGNATINTDGYSIGTYVLLNYSCYTGMFDTIIYGGNPNFCTNIAYSETQLSLNILPCNEDIYVNYDLYYLIIPGGIIVILIPIIIIILKVKKIRKVVFPYRDRKKYEIKNKIPSS